MLEVELKAYLNRIEERLDRLESIVLNLSNESSKLSDNAREELLNHLGYLSKDIRDLAP